MLAVLHPCGSVVTYKKQGETGMRKRVLPAILGGLAFALVTILFASFSGDDPDYARSAIGGAAFTAAWLLMIAWRERRS